MATTGGTVAARQPQAIDPANDDAAAAAGMMGPSEADALIGEIAARARSAARELALLDGETRAASLRAAAAAVRDAGDAVLSANAIDLEAAHASGMSGALIDRLTLDPARLDGIAKGLEAVAALPDPIGDVMADWTRPNGLRIRRVRVPLGVIGIIYESRPNVTADAGGLAIKSGNAAILRGGSDSYETSGAILTALRDGLAAKGVPADAIQRVPTRDRAAVGAMLRARGLIDVLVPRGGKGLNERVLTEARMPVIGHLEGLCHVYVDRAADPDKARRVVVNAKMRRTGICGAAETLLVDSAIAPTLLPALVADLREAGCAIRGDEATRAIVADAEPAAEADWTTEYLDAILSVRIVDGVEGAIAHIGRYSSGHTESIITEDDAAAARFTSAVDSAIVMVNASTQFADGGEFGMGAEIGISTDKFHARGPVGAEQLTSYKYVVVGDGQTRP